jgi:hypothetical protein
MRSKEKSAVSSNISLNSYSGVLEPLKLYKMSAIFKAVFDIYVNYIHFIHPRVRILTSTRKLTVNTHYFLMNLIYCININTTCFSLLNGHHQVLHNF